MTKKEKKNYMSFAGCFKTFIMFSIVKNSFIDQSTIALLDGCVGCQEKSLLKCLKSFSKIYVASLAIISFLPTFPKTS